jgi:hypothetical protein
MLRQAQGLLVFKIPVIKRGRDKLKRGRDKIIPS